MIGRLFNEILERDADAYFTKKVREFKGKIIGANENSELFGELNDVNGFKFLNLKILSPLNVHVYKGCKLFFAFESEILEVESDSLEIYTDYSKKLKMGITSIDVDLENIEETLRSRNLKSIRFEIEKNIISFEIHHPNFIEVLDTPVEPDDTQMGNESMDPFMQE
jgi:hypothetical protein